MSKNRKRIILIVFVFVALAAGLLFYFSKPEIKAKRALAQGNKYLQELDYEKAIVEFQKVLQIDPTNTDAYLLLADAYIAQGNDESALEILRQGYELTGDQEIKKRLDELSSKLVPEETAEETAEAESIESGLPYEKSQAVFNALSEIWEYDVFGKAFDDWVFKDFCNYISTSAVEVYENVDSTSYQIQNGVSGTIHHDNSGMAELFDESINGYAQFQEFATEEMGTLVLYIPYTGKYPLAGKSIEDFFAELGTSLEDVTKPENKSDDSAEGQELFVYPLGEGQHWQIIRYTDTSGSYLVSAYDYNRKHRLAWFSVYDGVVINCVSIQTLN